VFQYLALCVRLPSNTLLYSMIADTHTHTHTHTHREGGRRKGEREKR